MSPRPKLSPTERSELIQRRQAGERLKVLAHDYGVSMTHVKRLCEPIHPKLSEAVKARAGRPT